MDELSKDDSKASEDRPVGRDTEELLKRGRDLMSFPVIDLILWGKKRKELPPLSRDLWKRVAARCYRDALVVSDMIPSEAKWVRLVCGSLTVRAARLGYDELASQYHSRYLARAGETVDDDAELQVAMDHIVDMEDSYRASLADFPRR